MGRRLADGSEACFDAYVEGSANVIGYADRVTRLEAYCTGLLLPGERKNVEPMRRRFTQFRPPPFGLPATIFAHHLIPPPRRAERQSIGIVLVVVAIAVAGTVAIAVDRPTAIGTTMAHAVALPAAAKRDPLPADRIGPRREIVYHACDRGGAGGGDAEEEENSRCHETMSHQAWSPVAADLRPPTARLL